jgi:methylmalonyl-CoA mutase cobalamin-binding subunit
MPLRRPRRSVVVLAGEAASGVGPASALAASLVELGVETTYLGQEENPARIAAAALDLRADAIELCLARGSGVQLLRALLRELTGLGRRDVSIVVHRVC